MVHIENIDSCKVPVHVYIAVLKLLNSLQVSCKDYFDLTTTVLDSIHVFTPVSIEDSIQVCFVSLKVFIVLYNPPRKCWFWKTSGVRHGKWSILVVKPQNFVYVF